MNEPTLQTEGVLRGVSDIWDSQGKMAGVDKKPSPTADKSITALPLSGGKHKKKHPHLQA